MANKWAIANGTWDTPSIWNDGIIPYVGDTVYANGKTVQFNNNINIGDGWLRNDANAELGVVAGGLFSSTSGNNTEEVTANVYGCNNTVCVYLGTSGQKTINGNLSSDESGACVRYDTNSTTAETCGTLTINGNVEGRIDADSTNDSSMQVLVINGDWTVKTSDYAFRVVRTNWYRRAGTNISVSGQYNHINQFSNGIGTVYFLSVGSIICRSNLSTQIAGSSISLNQPYITMQNLARIIGWQLGITFDGENSYIYDNMGNILMCGVNVINYPQESEVKAGVIYGNGKIGTYALTDEAIERVSNCVTNDTLQATMEDYFGGE